VRNGSWKLAADQVYVRTDSALSFQLETVGNPGVLELVRPHTHQIGFITVPLDLLLCGSPGPRVCALHFSTTHTTHTRTHAHTHTHTNHSQSQCAKRSRRASTHEGRLAAVHFAQQAEPRPLLHTRTAGNPAVSSRPRPTRQRSNGGLWGTELAWAMKVLRQPSGSPS
jgi:hypothetical protein